VDSDLTTLFPAFQEVYKKIPFQLKVISGSQRPSLNPPVPWVWSPYSASRPVDDYGDATLAVAYYRDDEFGHCKGNYKVKTYMAAGKAVITSDVDYNRVLIKDGANGLLAKTPEDWIRHLTTLLSTPSLAQPLGQAARQSILERYSYPVIAQQYAALLKRHFPL